jgi:hypothetical protein
VIRVTVDRMRLLVDTCAALTEVSDAAEEWLSAKESEDDREAIRDARDELDALLEDAEGSILDLYSLLGRKRS